MPEICFRLLSLRFASDFNRFLKRKEILNCFQLTINLSSVKYIYEYFIYHSNIKSTHNISLEWHISLYHSDITVLKNVIRAFPIKKLFISSRFYFHRSN